MIMNTKQKDEYIKTLLIRLDSERQKNANLQNRLKQLESKEEKNDS